MENNNLYKGLVFLGLSETEAEKQVEDLSLIMLIQLKERIQTDEPGLDFENLEDVRAFAELKENKDKLKNVLEDITCTVLYDYINYILKDVSPESKATFLAILYGQ